MQTRRKKRKKDSCEYEFTGTRVNLNSLVSFWFVLLEALAAVDRPAAIGLEGNLGFLPAIGTRDRVHFTLFVIHTIFSLTPNFASASLIHN